MLKLIVASPCPYCAVVTQLIEEKALNVDIIDTQWDPKMHDTLREKYGKSQVPLLLIDDTPLYESNDIIAYLKEHAHEYSSGN
ncbi:MAG: glutathione S-transferase N-terminal domain-containing protein [Candidatus Marinamargulisbacteria bacterium]